MPRPLFPLSARGVAVRVHPIVWKRQRFLHAARIVPGSARALFDPRVLATDPSGETSPSSSICGRAAILGMLGVDRCDASGKRCEVQASPESQRL